MASDKTSCLKDLKKDGLGQLVLNLRLLKIWHAEEIPLSDFTESYFIKN